MNPLEIALSAIGILAALTQALGVALLRDMRQQNRDTNHKVTNQGEVVAGLAASAGASARELGDVREKLYRMNEEVMKLVGARELAQEIVRALDDREERRRQSRRRADPGPER